MKTMVGDKAQPCPRDRVNRQFHAQRPNALWVDDFTCVSAWQCMVYVAFVTDVYARRIVGWKASSSMTADFVLDALGQALHARRWEGTLIPHGAAAIRRNWPCWTGCTGATTSDCWANGLQESRGGSFVGQYYIGANTLHWPICSNFIGGAC